MPFIDIWLPSTTTKVPLTHTGLDHLQNRSTFIRQSPTTRKAYAPPPVQEEAQAASEEDEVGGAAAFIDPHQRLVE